MDYYTDIKRSEFAYINVVGAKPFLLFKYYLTYSTAEKICPSLETIARDMGMVKDGKPQVTAVCNLNKILVDEKWISIEKGEVKILKSFRISESHSEKVNETDENHSEILNDEPQDSENVNQDSEILNEYSEKVNGTELAKIGFINEEEKEDYKERKEEELPTPVRVNGKQFGTPVNSTFSPFIQTCLAGMKLRLNTPHTLPKEIDWLLKFEFWELNDSTPDLFLETYDLLEKIRKKKKARWTITPDTMEKNFGKTESLRIELEELELGEQNAITYPTTQQPTQFKSERERREQDKLAEAAYFAEIERRVRESDSKLSG